MGRTILILGMLAVILAVGTVAAYADTGSGGNSFAWLRDNDGDGIPNGMDDDWTRPEDGTGYQLKHRFGFVLVGPLGGLRDGNSAYQTQRRERKNQPEAPGDCLRIHLQLRDGSCK
jgi:hypothetical protein